MGNLYLVLYNTTLCAAWAYVLFLAYSVALVDQGTTADIWRVVEIPLKLAQTAAVMEVVHSALGVVRSPVMITATQVSSRLWVLWGLINLEPERTTGSSVQVFELQGISFHLDLLSLLTAWCITEVIRYGFFACKEMGSEPYLIKWLRYSAFLPLYPLGVASELTMAFLALPGIAERRPWSWTMPNPLNFALDYHVACWVIIALYLPGLPQLYTYMLKQRSKVLGKPAAAPKAKKS